MPRPTPLQSANALLSIPAGNMGGVGRRGQRFGAGERHHAELLRQGRSLTTRAGLTGRRVSGSPGAGISLVPRGWGQGIGLASGRRSPRSCPHGGPRFAALVIERRHHLCCWGDTPTWGRAGGVNTSLAGNAVAAGLWRRTCQRVTVRRRSMPGRRARSVTQGEGAGARDAPGVWNGYVSGRQPDEGKGATGVGSRRRRSRSPTVSG
jgi:hypothetical protein